MAGVLGGGRQKTVCEQQYNSKVFNNNKKKIQGREGGEWQEGEECKWPQGCRRLGCGCGELEFSWITNFLPTPGGARDLVLYLSESCVLRRRWRSAC